MFLAIFAASAMAAEPTLNNLVAQLYQDHRSKHDPLTETQLLGRYFETSLLKLYLSDQRKAQGEVGRLDGDPLYNAQDMKITDFTISAPEKVAEETRISVRFKNFGKPTRVIFTPRASNDGWKISDVRYDDGTSLQKILQSSR